MAAGLVERPQHMPGRQLEYGMWGTEGLVVKRVPVAPPAITETGLMHGRSADRQRPPPSRA